MLNVDADSESRMSDLTKLWKGDVGSDRVEYGLDPRAHFHFLPGNIKEVGRQYHCSVSVVDDDPDDDIWNVVRECSHGGLVHHHVRLDSARLRRFDPL